MSSAPIPRVHELQDHAGDLAGKKRWDRVADLRVLLGPVTGEEVVVLEGLETCSLTHREASALRRIGMDEVVPVLGDVSDDGGRPRTLQLNPEAVGERHFLRKNVAVSGQQRGGRSAIFGENPFTLP